MRMSKAAFWDFPLTPNKVRAEQGRQVECKHFKRHFGETKITLEPKEAEKMGTVSAFSVINEAHSTNQTGMKTP